MRLAFNIWNYELAEIFFKLSKAYNTPIILQTSEQVVRIIDRILFISHINKLKQLIKSDVILNLDHAKDFGLIKECIGLGWDMVMYDGSSLSFQENLRNTEKVARIAGKNVLLEASLGRIPGAEDAYETQEFKFTDLNLASEFVQKTGVDYLALSIGTKHGFCEDKGLKLDFKLLSEANKYLKVKLVLHGASGLSPETLTKLIKLGIEKINISTEVKKTYFDALAQISCLGYNDYLNAKTIMEDIFQKFFQDKLRIIKVL